MPIATGTRLGPYEIVGHIGSGGMGEVYRARDNRLNRQVAIKVLPAALARDPDRMARLEQEARAAAALNAPGIVAVHDIGTYDPSGSGEVSMFVVMELLDGESLRSRLDTGSIPPRKAAEFAAQVASALAAAHQRGIVHRDLKPENLFLTKDGRIKILDFGLAKAMSALPAGASLATGVANTAAGTVLGTVGYMAPEQVRGEPADARSDIFALGATLYEMLSGKRAFARASAVETMNAILKEEPPDLDPEMTAAIPGALQAILSRCLEKRPEDRFHSAHDLALALQAAGMGRATTSGVERVVATRSSPRLAVLLGIAALVVGVAAVALALKRRPPAAPLVASLRQLTDLPGAENHPDISPDGRQVLYSSSASGNGDIYLLRVGGRAINLTAGSPEDDVQGAFSPDGERIAFRSERDGGGLYVMGATGESVRRVTTTGFDPAWSPDGTMLAFGTEAVRDPYSRSTTSELWAVDLASGASKKLVTTDAVQPAWSPHGDRIAFWTNTQGQRDIQTVAAAGGSPVQVTRDAATDWAPEWSPDGRWLYFVSDRGGSPNLWRVAIDEKTGAASGAPEPITNGVRALASARFSRDGSRMAIAATDRSFELSMYAFDPAKPDRPTLKSTIRSASLGWCAPSSDGSWLACTARTGQEDLVLLRSDGSETRRLIDDAFKDRIPTWSPDGRTLAFMSTRTGGWELWAIEADGSGLRQLTDFKITIGWGAWSPDRARLAVSAITGDPGVWIMDPSRTSTRQTAQFSPADARVAGGARLSVDTWSSDGALLAGPIADAAGDPIAIGVLDAKTGALRSRFPVRPVRSSALDLTFVPGTRQLLVNLATGLSLVDADTGAVRTILPLVPAFTSRLSADGRTLLVERPGVESDLWLMEMGK
jgi:Tol biopolymer transport system component